MKLNKTIRMCVPLGLGIPAAALAQNVERPNFLIIVTDQQSHNMMSYFSGDRYFSTPNMDFLAEDGYTFTNSYCTYPLSVPSRVAMFTGQYPATFGVRKNHKVEEMGDVNVDAIEAYYPNMMGTLFRNAGYDVYYGGKSHLTTRAGNNTGDTAPYGFPQRYSRDSHGELGTAAAKLLESLSRKKGKPFLMVASFINPHYICDYHVLIKDENDGERKKKLPRMDATLRYIDEITSQYTEEKLYDEVLPPLAPNHALTADAPEAFIPGQKTRYTPRHWQMHQWIYGKLTEDVDSDIAPVISVLRKQGMLENTVVVFVSDHGDQQGAHGREMKMAPYQESQLVPFVFAGCGIKSGVLDTENVINSGIDLVPTLCDFAGIEIPSCMPGKSLKGIISGTEKKLDRRDIFCEGPNWFQIIRDGRYKYTVFEAPDHPDMLIDLENDPGEMQNLSNNPQYKNLRECLHNALMEQLKERGIVLRDNVKRPAV